MIYLRQSTASQEIILGRFLDSTDGNTEETGLTIANTDIDIWKTGATSYVDKNSGGATHIAGGLYYCTLDATDTNTIGPMRIDVHVSGALAVTTYCTVLDEAVYDVLFGTVAPSTLSAGALMGLADDAITAAKFDESTAFPQTGDAYARLGAPAGASVSADVAAVKVDTAAILVDTGTTLDTLIKDIPTVAEFEARTLLAADYTVVSDLAGIAQESTLNTVAGYLDTEIAAILEDTGTTLPAAIADIPTVAEFNARTLPSADYTVVSDLPAEPDNASIAAILVDTGTTIPAAIAALPTDADVNAACDTAIADAALATAAALATVDGIVDDILVDTGTTIPASIAAINVAAKKNTALANFAFVMTDDTNHELATGLTVTCTRSIDGGAFAGGTLANVTEVAAGVYNVDFGAGDLNGDVVVLRATATGADDTIVTIVTAK